MTLYNLDEIIAALKAANGRPREAAKALGVNPRYIHVIMTEHPEWREAIRAHINYSKKPAGETEHQRAIATALRRYKSVAGAAEALGISVSAIRQVGNRSKLVREQLDAIKQSRALYTPHEIAAMLRATGGDIEEACKRLCVSERYIYGYMSRNPKSRKIIGHQIKRRCRWKQHREAKVSAIVQALRKHDHTATAARELGITATVIYQLAKRHEAIREQLDAIKRHDPPITPERARAALAEHGTRAGLVLGRSLRWVKEVAKRGNND